ncbi:MAG: TolC family protein, partial [Candidatus Acidiferrum sp.]
MRILIRARRGAELILLAGTSLIGVTACGQTAATLQTGAGVAAAQSVAPNAAPNAGTAIGEQQSGGVVLTLKSAIEMALRNSKDIQVGKLQASLAEHASLVSRAEFMPNLYAGSGAGYTYGIPETPG